MKEYVITYSEKSLTGDVIYHGTSILTAYGIRMLVERGEVIITLMYELKE